MSRSSRSTDRLTASAAILLLGSLSTFACGGSDGGVGPGPTVASVTVAPASGAVEPGETLQLTASAKDASGAVLQGHTIMWSSNDNGVATVTSAGLVTGVAPGTATVTATSEGKSGQAAIAVHVLDVSGPWSFSETITDPALGLSCTDQATMTMTQTGATFTGTSQQTGTCTVNGTPFDNSGPFDLTGGQVQHAAIEFVEPGQPACEYSGTLTGDPPTGASGTVVCTGDVPGLGHVNATGTWQIRR